MFKKVLIANRGEIAVRVSRTLRHLGMQVEHGFTKLATGLDLVEWMVRLGAGENPIAGFDKVEAKFAAMEVRVYAEDAAKAR